MSILVVAEHDNNTLKPATLGAISAASAIAATASGDSGDDNRGNIAVLVAGSGCGAVAEAAAAVAGVGQVICADHAVYEHQLPEAVAPLVVETVRGLLGGEVASEDCKWGCKWGCGYWWCRWGWASDAASGAGGRWGRGGDASVGKQVAQAGQVGQVALMCWPRPPRRARILCRGWRPCWGWSRFLILPRSRPPILSCARFMPGMPWRRFNHRRPLRCLRCALLHLPPRQLRVALAWW